MTLLAYIDPTGGLPPSLWGMIVAWAVAAAAAAWAGLRGLPHRTLAAIQRWGNPCILGMGMVGIIAITIVINMMFNKGNRSGQPARSISPRVLLLGFDGLDPVLLNQYMSEGRLPHFARLAKEGVYHPLRTTTPPQSPVAWSSFITGSNPAQHGVFDFVRRDPKRYTLDLAIADRHRMTLPWKGTPFWEGPVLRQFGMTAMRMPLCFPPPKLNGRLLAGMGVWDVRGTEGTYFFYSTEPIEKKDARGMLFSFQRQGNALRGELPGPYRAGETDDTREPFELDLSGEAAILRVQGRSYPLTANHWSEWIRIEFRLGALRLQRIEAITRMLLSRKSAQVTLYVSPLNFDPAAPLYPISHPGEYSAELCDAIGCYHTRGMPHDTQAVNDGVLSDEAFLDQCRTITDESEKMLSHELTRFHRGLLFAYFETPDVIQHLFWRTIDPQHPLHNADGAERIRRVIPEYYERLDAILGRARAALGQQGETVVMSDHGFAPFRRAVHLNAILRDAGFLLLRKNIRTSPEFFKEVDWSRTQAYALGFNALYLNLVGREGRGIVRPEDAERVRRSIAERLESFVDIETGMRPIKRARRVDETGPTDANRGSPDLIVGYARGYRASWETALGAVAEKTEEPNLKKWSGDHCIDADEVPGIFLSSDPAMDAANLQEIGAAIERYLGKTHGN